MPADPTAGCGPYLDALGKAEEHPAVAAIIARHGGISEVAEIAVGAPTRRDRRLSLTGGVQILLQDDAVVALVFQVASGASGGFVAVGDLISVARAETSRKELRGLLANQQTHGGDPRAEIFAVDGGFLLATYSYGPYDEPGHLARLMLTADNTWGAINPADSWCPACSDLLQRDEAAPGGVDVSGTIEALLAGVAQQRLYEDASRVLLADLGPLHASGLMERAESQVKCSACTRNACFTLGRAADPMFGYYSSGEAWSRPREPIPPVVQWGDADRLARDRDGLHLVAVGPQAWFLMRQGDDLLLDARYSVGAFDGSVLILLNADEREGYRTGGRDYLDALQDRIHMGGPNQESSPFYARNLYRGPGGKDYRAAVTQAIAQGRSETGPIG